MPATGMVVHALEQYGPDVQDEARAVFEFPATLSILTVVPDSPASIAGLLPGDGITSINGTAVREADAEDRGTSRRRDEIERYMVALAPAGAIRLSIRRDDREFAVDVHPVPACLTRFEVSPGLGDWAISNGETIQFSPRFFARFSDTALAVVAAHELAHNILGHRARLERDNIRGGLAGALGRSARLVRDAEDEADRFSVHLLSSAGFNPRMAVDFWHGEGRAIGGGLFHAPTHRGARARAALMAAEIEKLEPAH
ncbi:M48 family metallopeptidase [Sphingobium baderi]|uniref:M48 family metallopeptidase n=1 Tax=Sphingobium baderi TaxID=1332080 RepID=UPI002B408E8B|nr:M48 family metallopeptidase [Sphingobium baderi]WRD78793.1 M48 family metallopeptidase [Sphingobium baderi]